MYLLLAALAAVLFAASTVLKHRSAQAVARPAGQDGTGVLGVVRRTLRHPAWLAGIAFDAGALALQVIALHLGPLAAVQPLLSASLVVALLLDRRRVPVAVWGWSIVLLAGLTGFVTLSGIGSSSAITTPDVGTSVVACAVVTGVIAGCLALARRMHIGLLPASALGLGVGVSYAASAALLKVLGDHAVQRGLLTVLWSWQLYAVLLCGAAGVLLNQFAFSAGPLRHSLPVISAVDPLGSVVLGIVVFDERLHAGSLRGVVDLALLGVVVLAIVRIGRARTSPRGSSTRSSAPARTVAT